MQDLDEWLNNYCESIKPFICDTRTFLKDSQAAGKSILFEAQLGSLRDLDEGIYPYTTSTNTIAAYAPVGAGCPSAKIDDVIGIVKAYSTCVGEGPFVSELQGPEADALREAGAEYGAKTGRPRRVGAMDIVATRYGVELQDATEIALTKLDVLSYMERIPVCVKYLCHGKELTQFPFPAELDSCVPVIKYMKGWKTDISKIKKWEDLPHETRAYVEFIEANINCPITYVSVGPERDSIIYRKKA